MTDMTPGAIVPDDMVCNTLIAPNGTAYYADDYGHRYAAMAIGYGSDPFVGETEEAMRDGYVHVAITYPDISFYGRLTPSQKRRLEEMYFSALMHREVKRCETFIKAYVAIALTEGLETAE